MAAAAKMLSSKPAHTTHARCASGIKFNASIRTRPGQAISFATATSLAGSGALFDDSASMAIGNSNGGELWAAPHAQIRFPKRDGRAVLAGRKFRQVNPGDGRVEMMVQVPLVV